MIDSKKFINECLVKLGLPQDIKVSVLNNDKMLDRFSVEGYRLDAMLHKTAIPHTYILYIRSDIDDIRTILAHEMIHLQQYERGDLQIESDTGVVIWRGERYNNRSEYMSRPWEIEAFKRQRELLKKTEVHKVQS